MAISSSGMKGFSEDGEPDAWDTAMGEVYGYRWWLLSLPAGLAGFRYKSDPADPPFNLSAAPLIGANARSWEPGRNEAVCTSTNAYRVYRHEPPEYREACGCGFWAYFDSDLNPADVLAHSVSVKPRRNGNHTQLPIFGVVKGTGRVIIGERGFRSQYAEIAGLCVPDFARLRLSFNITPDWEPARSVWTDSRYFDAESALRSLALGIPTGPGVVYTNPYGMRGHYQIVTRASETEILTRVATVETVLEAAYPGAKIFTSQHNMVKYFPPDKNYGPGSAFSLDSKYGPA